MQENEEKEEDGNFSPSASAGVFTTSAGQISKDNYLDSIAKILNETHPHSSNAEIVTFNQSTLPTNTSGVIKVTEEDIANLYQVSDSSFTEL